MAAVYWKFEGANEEWSEKYPDELAMYPDGGFVFTIAALVCLSVIRVRRVIFGGELGGPPDMKATSSFLLIMLWVTYIALQIWKSGAQDASITDQVVAVTICVPVLLLLMFIFLALLQVLKISKKYIGESGFWGIFVVA